jgi:hypothetical protein
MSKVRKMLDITDGKNGYVFLENPMETPFIPSWSRVYAADPDIVREMRDGSRGTTPNTPIPEPERTRRREPGRRATGGCYRKRSISGLSCDTSVQPISRMSRRSSACMSAIARSTPARPAAASGNR